MFIRLYRASEAARRKRQDAHSLVEVAIASVLISVMVISLYGAFASGFATIQASREELRATQILQQQLEAVRLCSWSQLSNCPIRFVDYYNPYATNVSNKGLAYGGVIGVSPATNLPASALYSSNMVLITVSVSWTNFNGARATTQTRQMQTQAALYGLQNYIWGAGS